VKITSCIDDRREKLVKDKLFPPCKKNLNEDKKGKNVKLSIYTP
jgi:hypothetical protein